MPDLAAIADAFVRVPRSPVLHRPSVPYETVTFPATDGVPLEGWFIPAPGADKLIIANHPMGFTRSGMPTHLEPWHSVWAPSGNGFEVNFVPDYRILHAAGYAVLAYDLRNHGLSGSAHGGVVAGGIFEARDVVGSLTYARRRPDTRDMTIGLFSRCMGATSTFAAMAQCPAAFEGVAALVAPQPVTSRNIMIRRLALLGMADRFEELERLVVERAGVELAIAARVPVEWARQVRVPTFLYQVHDDVLTTPGDVQAMYDAIPLADKALHWIEGTTARWDGYLEFQRRPEPMLDWFAKHL
ncbi:alpha/beta hydrolase [Actinoplanes sp. N902-109]|uniref:alpha/beta hydrolase n=1 Tax=Actinoplanes sp. (strain N902-109) TaxID=649831 RepID=UPI0003294627|nr:alpha/beta hydrolase [Actinoplanes sp. N902-109]AGL15187.1 hypothetical protein L083_1677 [Actinoplanes sp. N902-109]